MRALAVLLVLGLAAGVGAQDLANPELAAQWDLTDPGLYAVFQTSMGTFVAELFEEQVPSTVANFVELATGTKPWRAVDRAELIAQIQREGNVRSQEEALTRLEELTEALPLHEGEPLFDGTIFHRVAFDQDGHPFIIQGGSPTGTGSGGPGFNIEDEFNAELLHDQPGRLSMANIGRPDTGSCQFFVTLEETPWLDFTSPGNQARGTGHAVFGQVIHNYSVVEAISQVERDANDRPLQDVVLQTVTIVRVPAVTDSAPETTAEPASAPETTAVPASAE